MLIETSTWGSLEITKEQIYEFPKGIPGFEQETRFALLALEEGPFAYLQSLKKQGLAFVVVDPFIFYPDYEFDLSESESRELSLKPEQVYIRSIVTLKDPIENSSLNLLAPIVINSETRVGKQVVLHHSSYRTNHPLWTMAAAGSDDPSGKAGV